MIFVEICDESYCENYDKNKRFITIQTMSTEMTMMMRFMMRVSF